MVDMLNSPAGNALYEGVINNVNNKRLDMIRELDKDFKRRDRHFVCIEANESYYIYKVIWNEGMYNEYITYEVFKRKVKAVGGLAKESLKYKDYTHYIAYPCDNDFGYWAWSTNEKYLQETIDRLKGEGKLL